MAQKVRKVILIGAKGRLDNIYNLAVKIFATAITNILCADSVELRGIATTLARSEAIVALRHKQDGLNINFQKLYDEVRTELQEDFPVVVTDDTAAISEASLIVSATNTQSEIIHPDMIGNRPMVICDIAVPADVSPLVQIMSNVKVIKGGVVEIPNDDYFKIPGIILPKGAAYACMSETLLLGLEGVNNHYSCGAISLDQVKGIYKLAKKHGFKLKQAKLEASY